MPKSAPRTLLNALRQRLGQAWTRLGGAAMYRAGDDVLIQCISYQTSNFDGSYVPATFVQVLAHPSDSLEFHFGGRLKGARGEDLWLSAAEDPKIDLVYSALQEQSWPNLHHPLNLETVRQELAKRAIPRSSPHYAWCAGIVFGLCGDSKNAENCFSISVKELRSLHRSLAKGVPEKSIWTTDALEEVNTLQSLLPDADAFRTHCLEVAQNTKRALKLV